MLCPTYSECGAAYIPPGLMGRDEAWEARKKASAVVEALKFAKREMPALALDAVIERAVAAEKAAVDTWIRVSREEEPCKA